MKNLKIRKKVMAMALAGTLATCTLTGYGKEAIKESKEINQVEDNQSNLAIVFGNETATVINIVNYIDYKNNKNRMNIRLPGNITMVTSENSKMLVANKSIEEVEELSKNIIGENKKITYHQLPNIEYHIMKNRVYLFLTDGSVLATSTDNTMVVPNTSINDIEKISRNIMGENVKINYYNLSNQIKHKKR